MDGMGGGMMLWMVVWGLVGLAALVLAVVGIVWLVRRIDADTRSSEPRKSADSPEEILRRRYAAGELDEDEYLRRQSGLGA
ncbi:MAG: SHOCT domain-containing protein [Nocardioidaceae bacterium]|nr:SHOCT domain-containing protein [Nocardioidaceae bacterium]